MSVASQLVIRALVTDQAARRAFSSCRHRIANMRLCGNDGWLRVMKQHASEVKYMTNDTHEELDMKEGMYNCTSLVQGYVP